MWHVSEQVKVLRVDSNGTLLAAVGCLHAYDFASLSCHAYGGCNTAGLGSIVSAACCSTDSVVS